jgi:hypothetical protein
VLNALNVTLESVPTNQLRWDLIDHMLRLVCELVLTDACQTRDLRSKTEAGSEAPTIRTTTWMKLRKYIKLELVAGDTCTICREFVTLPFLHSPIAVNL